MTWRATRTILRDGQRFEAGEAVDLGADPQNREALERIGAVEWVEEAPDPLPPIEAPVDPAPEPEPSPAPAADAAPKPKRGRAGT